MKVLIVVDYQNDFVADNGKLTCGKMAQDIEQNIYDLIQKTEKEGGTVFFTMDWHDKNLSDNNPEKRLFPQHCVRYTDGASIYGRINDLSYAKTKIYKDSYSMSRGSLDGVVSSFEEIILCGVATNICVLQNAINLYNTAIYKNRKIDFFIAENACASFDEQAHKDAIQYMKNILGFKGENI